MTPRRRWGVGLARWHRTRPYRDRPPAEGANARNSAAGAKKGNMKTLCSTCSAQQSARIPKRCPGTTLGVLGKLREPCLVRAQPNPAHGRATLVGTETARVRARTFRNETSIQNALVRLNCKSF